MNKILADRRASVQHESISTRVQAEIKKVFTRIPGINVRYFPEQSGDIPNTPSLTLAVLASDRSKEDPIVEKIIRESGTTDRTYKSAVIFVIANSENVLRDKARKVLAWEDIREQEWDNLNEVQKRQLEENLKKAQRDATEAVWRTYKYIVLLGKGNILRTVDLGLVTSSSADASKSMTAIIINRLKTEDDIQDSIAPRFLSRNWSPAFKEWSTKAIRDAFFRPPASPDCLTPMRLRKLLLKVLKKATLPMWVKHLTVSINHFTFRKIALGQIRLKFLMIFI